MNQPEPQLGGVACDFCRDFAMLVAGAMPEGWKTITLATGAELDICAKCIAGGGPRILPGMRAREIAATEIIGGKHDGYTRPPRVGTVRALRGTCFAEMDWDPGTDHTGLPEDPVLRWSWDIVDVLWLEPVP